MHDDNTCQSKIRHTDWRDCCGVENTPRAETDGTTPVRRHVKVGPEGGLSPFPIAKRVPFPMSSAVKKKKLGRSGPNAKEVQGGKATWGWTD